jgi:hypothetical protein
VKLTPVNSSTLQAIGYADGEMRIEFLSGATYSYKGKKVEAYFQALMAADSRGESIGKYFSAHVRRCPDTICTRIEKLLPDESLIPQLEASLR